MAGAKQNAVIVSVKQNPSEDEHHDVRSDALSEEPILVFWSYSFQDGIFRKIVRHKIDDYGDVNAIVSIRICNVILQTRSNI